MFAHLGNDLIDVFAGNRISSGAREFFNQQSTETLGSVGSQTAQFFQQMQGLYQVISEIDATQILRNLEAKKENAWQGNNIVQIHSLPQLQTAGPVMQRWLMANEALRTMYLNNEVQGYGDSYTNYHGDNVGARHYDWRRVMDGMVQETADGYHYTQYFETIPEDDPELTLYQKVDILRSWSLVEHYLNEADEDPTSPEGNKL